MVAEYDLLGCPIGASQRMQPYGMGGCFHRNPQTVETESFVELRWKGLFRGII
jgi:hypothetical protein